MHCSHCSLHPTTRLLYLNESGAVIFFSHKLDRSLSFQSPAVFGLDTHSHTPWSGPAVAVTSAFRMNSLRRRSIITPLLHLTQRSLLGLTQVLPPNGTVIGSPVSFKAHWCVQHTVILTTKRARSVAIARICSVHTLQCFDTVGWASGRASGL